MKLNKEYLLELAEKREKIAIHTETQEQWNEILNVYRNSKFTCSIQNRQFESYKEESCINPSHKLMDRISFGTIDFFKEEGLRILSYSDVCIVFEQETTLELDKDFLIAQRGKNVVINCKTQEEWNNIVSILEDDVANHWHIYNEKTCIGLTKKSLTWERIEYWQDKEYKILSYEYCCKKEIKEELKTINIRIGDEIGKLIISKTALELLKNGEKIRVF